MHVLYRGRLEPSLCWPEAAKCPSRRRIALAKTLYEFLRAIPGPFPLLSRTRARHGEARLGRVG